MSFDGEKRVASRLLAALEDGDPPLAQVREGFEQADPALVALIFAWLRVRYRAGHPASDGVLGRLVELCALSPVTARHAKSGASDPIVAWFEEAYTLGDLDRETLISEVVEKLEG